LTQEMKGSTAGVAVSQLAKQLAGGFQNSHGALKEFVRLGMIPADKVDYLKNGEAKQLKPGYTPPWLHKALSDPDKFTFEDVMPALKKAGYDTSDKMLDHVSRLFPNSNVADLIGKMIVQQASYEQHAKQYEAASGAEGGAKMLSEDPGSAWDSFKTQLTNLGANFAELPVKAFGIELGNVTSALSKMTAQVAQQNKDHPVPAGILEGATIAGALALGTKWTIGLASRVFGMFGGGAGATSAAPIAATTAASTVAPPVAGGLLSALGGLVKMGGAIGSLAAIPTLDYRPDQKAQDDAIIQGVKDWWHRSAKPEQSGSGAPTIPDWRNSANARANLPYLGRPDLQGIGNEPDAPLAPAHAAAMSAYDPMRPPASALAAHWSYSQMHPIDDADLANSRATQGGEHQGADMEAHRGNALGGLGDSADQLKQKLGALDVTIEPHVGTASLDAALAKATSLLAILSSIGSISVGGASGGATASPRQSSFTSRIG
jgi:hypothetical protein